MESAVVTVQLYSVSKQHKGQDQPDVPLCPIFRQECSLCPCPSPFLDKLLLVSFQAWSRDPQAFICTFFHFRVRKYFIKTTIKLGHMTTHFHMLKSIVYSFQAYKSVSNRVLQICKPHTSRCNPHCFGGKWENFQICLISPFHSSSQTMYHFSPLCRLQLCVWGLHWDARRKRVHHGLIKRHMGKKVYVWEGKNTRDAWVSSIPIHDAPSAPAMTSHRRCANIPYWIRNSGLENSQLKRSNLNEPSLTEIKLE